jgi:SpoVK/Ycf46/Vps4 family AAA+-type ATPase
LCTVVIDEVESLTAARKSASAGTEPSDAIRVVNALLTQLDQLKRYSNVLVLTTSNVTEAIDGAFVDRADLKIFIGNPSAEGRYQILRTALQELNRAELVSLSCPGTATLSLLDNGAAPVEETIAELLPACHCSKLFSENPEAVHADWATRASM